MTIAKITDVACIVSTGDGCFLKWLINDYEINSKKGKGRHCISILGTTGRLFVISFPKGRNFKLTGNLHPGIVIGKPNQPI